MKTLSIRLALALLLIAGVFYLGHAAMPRVEVINRTPVTILQVIVQLPSNRLVFDLIEPGGVSAISYDMDQLDGQYLFSVLFDDDVVVNGACGYVTHGEWLKRQQLTVSFNRSVVCGSR